MEFRRFGNTYMVRVDKGEDIVSKLMEFCRQEQITCGSVHGIGAAGMVEMGLYDTRRKTYIPQVKNGTFEITSLLGNITWKEGSPYLHLHITLSDDRGMCTGGHLTRCVVSATAEIVVTKLEGTVNRRFDQEIGLNLFQF